ncbi:MAG: hypothetical protein ACI81L_001533 [Verrucomicrobiales bacterium]|jgi:hypothetical protein
MVLVLLVTISASTFAAGLAELADIAPVGAQVTPIDDEPEDAPGLGSIIGTPEAGPKPDDPGDRGGYAQLGLAVVLVGGITFIGSRIVRESRRNRSNISHDGSL